MPFRPKASPYCYTFIIMRSRREGLSLLEVLVAALIFALIMAGLANIFVAGKQYILHSRSRISGGELGRYFLDNLQLQVNQSSWNTSCVGAANCTNGYAGAAQGLDKEYTANYTVTVNSPIANVSRVKTVINWTE